MKKILWHASLLTLFLAGPVLWRVHAESNQLPEYKVKAAFLYNFARFTEWPPGSSASPEFFVCVLGLNPFGESLDIIAGKPVQSRKVATRFVRDFQDIEGCDCLFVSDSEKKNLHQLLRAVGGKKILTVGDMEGFSEAGGIIEFVLYESKIRFVVNLPAAERAGLRISSKLLELATELKNR